MTAQGDESPPRWLIDELAHAGEEHLDADYVAAYDRKARFDPSDDLRVLQELGLGRTATLVDLGAGTGAFALAAAQLCGRVVAVDISPTMLSALRANAAQRGLKHVECVHAGFLTYEHRGDPADFVYSRNALHQLPEFWKGIALQRIARMLRSGGVLRLRDLVFSFDPEEAQQVIEPWLASAPENGEDGWTRQELEAHIREEHSTFSWLLEPMLQRAGFEIRETAYSASRTYAAYTCVKRSDDTPSLGVADDSTDRTRAWYRSLPAKRIGAGVLFSDAAGRILLVRPTYKSHWEIPGGLVERNEAPDRAAAREIGEELGVDRVPGRLLCVDWVPARDPKTDGLMFLFDGGVLDDAAAELRLPGDELAEYRFVPLDGLVEYLPAHMARRVSAAVRARSADTTVYLVDGYPGT